MARTIAGGSGLASYSIYVSDDGAAFVPLLINTTETSTLFTGENSHTYGFYSIATDNVGNVQPVPASAQATTTIANGLSLVVATQPPAGVLAGNAFGFTVDVFDSQDQIDSSYDGTRDGFVRE